MYSSLLCLFVVACTILVVNAVVIDNFEDGQVAPDVLKVNAVTGAGLSLTHSQEGNASVNIMGGEREVTVTAIKVNPDGTSGSASAVIENGHFQASSDGNVYGVWILTFDGADGSNSLNVEGLGVDFHQFDFIAVNLTSAPTKCIHIDVFMITAFVQVTLSKQVLGFEEEGVCVPLEGSQVLKYPFSEFAPVFFGNEDIDLRDIGAVQIQIDTRKDEADAVDFILEDIRVGNCLVPADCPASDACHVTQCYDELCIFEPLICPPRNVCSEYRCDPTDGCVEEDISYLCNDDVDCTDDSCTEEDGCIWGPNDDLCDDGIACTEAVCVGPDGDLESGCYFSPNDDLCDDEDMCTLDSCFVDEEMGEEEISEMTDDSGCLHEQVNCEDNDPCTADTCDSATGCVHTQIEGCGVEEEVEEVEEPEPEKEPEPVPVEEQEEEEEEAGGPPGGLQDDARGNGKGGMSGGQIAGIIFGILIGAVCLAVGLWYFQRWRDRNNPENFFTREFIESEQLDDFQRKRQIVGTRKVRK